MTRGYLLRSEGQDGEICTFRLLYNNTIISSGHIGPMRALAILDEQLKRRPAPVKYRHNKMRAVEFTDDIRVYLILTYGG
jgi:hypothetical protein